MFPAGGPRPGLLWGVLTPTQEEAGILAGGPGGWVPTDLVDPGGSGGSRRIWWIQVDLVDPDRSGGSGQIWWIRVDPGGSGGSGWIWWIQMDLVDPDAAARTLVRAPPSLLTAKNNRRGGAAAPPHTYPGPAPPQLSSGETGPPPSTGHSLRNAAGNARRIYRSHESVFTFEGRADQVSPLRFWLRPAGSAPAKPFIGTNCQPPPTPPPPPGLLNPPQTAAPW